MFYEAYHQYCKCLRLNDTLFVFCWMKSEMPRMEVFNRNIVTELSSNKCYFPLVVFVLFEMMASLKHFGCLLKKNWKISIPQSALHSQFPLPRTSITDIHRSTNVFRLWIEHDLSMICRSPNRGFIWLVMGLGKIILIFSLQRHFLGCIWDFDILSSKNIYNFAGDIWKTFSPKMF